jgi:hypothetical protein
MSGALLGGLIGSTKGKALEGALIGGAVGALAGYVIHKINTTQTRTAQQTVQDYNYQPNQGFKLDVRSGSVAPGTVNQGQSVKAAIEYATLGTGPSGVNVEEVRVLKKDQAVLTELNRDKVIRNDGTWRNEIEFQVPQNAAPGDYTIVQQVNALGTSYSKELTFSVITRSARNAGDTEKLLRVSLMTP